MSHLLVADHGATTASGLSVLTAHTDAPEVTQTTVQAHLLHALQVLTVGSVQGVGVQLRGLAILDVTTTVQEPRGDLKTNTGQ